MIPKERVLMTISHQEPDRVPIGEWEYGKELIEPILKRKTLFFSGIDTIRAYWDGKRNEIIKAWKEGLVELVQKLNWDAVLVHLVIGKETSIEAPEQVNDRDWQYKDGAIIRYSEETDCFLKIRRGTLSQANNTDSQDVNKLEPTESELEVVRYVIKKLSKTHFIFSAGLIGHPKQSFSDASVSEVENWVKLYEDPDGYRDRYLKCVNSPAERKGIEVAKREGIDGVASGCDYGYNAGPFMSPEMFRKAILPGLSAFCKLVHSFGLIALFHSCGNNQLLMDMIVEAGVDVYQSIQPEMDIKKMKKRYGKNITLWGGVPAGDLITSTPEEVKKEAIDYLNVCKPGGGYIFGTSHSIMPGAKYENYMAMLEAWGEYGIY